MARYGETMTEAVASHESAESLEAALREAVARGDAIAGSIAPILRHLLANEDNSVFSDEIVARVRGMIADVAAQLLDRRAAARGETDRSDHTPGDVSALTRAITTDPALLCHAHALALEWQLTERLQSRLALDPVLPPLLQALIASTDSETAALAMKLLASQARFCQAQRRMRLPLAELPGDLLHNALAGLRVLAGAEPEADSRAAAAETAIRAAYEEGHSRLGLISRLVSSMGVGAVAALSIGHAGVAIFLTALSIASEQDRDAVALSTNETQAPRLALALRAAGLNGKDVEEQLLALYPDVPLPEGFDRLGATRAAAILAATDSYGGWS